MKILVACEFSGVVSGAFREKGHDVTSCDLLPSEIAGRHYQGNVMDIINDNWDMLIGFPPCTYMSYAAKKYWNTAGRECKRIEAALFFLKLWQANHIPMIALENPVGYPFEFLGHPNQIFNPFNFGDIKRKRTCLWLKNLPPLLYGMQCDVKPVYVDKISGKKRYTTDALSGSSDKDKKERSRFSSGIAKAMAQQWG